MDLRQISRSDQLDNIVQKLIQALGDSSYRGNVTPLLKSVLWTIRNRMAFKQAIQFLDQLPLPLKAIYVDQWEIPEQVPENLRNMDELVEEMMQKDPGLFDRFQGNVEELEQAIKVILRLLGGYLALS